MAKSKSSRRWLDRHFNDEYVKRAQVEGYRSRASYKLLELQDKYQLIRRGDCVVDLGAAPGGWSQVAAKIVGPQGCVIALDILPMEPLPEVEFILGDFREAEPLAALQTALNSRPVDIVISDMAPNVSGMAAVDQPKSIYLCELALDFARNVLRPGGALVVKVFQGEGFDEFLREFRSSFKQVASRKPKASRQNSREVYLVGTNFTV